MKIRFLASATQASCVLSFTLDCAVLTKSRSQTVVVRSNPEGAVGRINGIEVGRTPFKILLNRSSTYVIELEKPGFGNTATVVLPVSSEYDKRFFRWGIDYDLGAVTDLTPNDLAVDLKPAVPPLSGGQDRYQEMNYRVLQADALLSTGEISPSDHKYLVAEIVKFYTN